MKESRIYILKSLAITTLLAGLYGYYSILKDGNAITLFRIFMKSGAFGGAKNLGVGLLITARGTCIVIIPFLKIAAGLWLLFLRPSSRVAIISVHTLDYTLRIAGFMMSTYLTFHCIPATHTASNLDGMPYGFDTANYFLNWQSFVYCIINLIDMCALSASFAKGALDPEYKHTAKLRKKKDLSFIATVIILSLGVATGYRVKTAAAFHLALRGKTRSIESFQDEYLYFLNNLNGNHASNFYSFSYVNKAKKTFNLHQMIRFDADETLVREICMKTYNYEWMKNDQRLPWTLSNSIFQGGPLRFPFYSFTTDKCDWWNLNSVKDYWYFSCYVVQKNRRGAMKWVFLVNSINNRVYAFSGQDNKIQHKPSYSFFLASTSATSTHRPNISYLKGRFIDYHIPEKADIKAIRIIKKGTRENYSLAHDMKDRNAIYKGAVQTNTLDYIHESNDIPIVKSNQFGFAYFFEGTPERKVIDLVEILTFPGEGLNNPDADHLVKKTTNSFPQVIGRINHFRYRFDYDWEMVPGEWKVEILHDGKKYAETIFNMVEESKESGQQTLR